MTGAQQMRTWRRVGLGMATGLAVVATSFGAPASAQELSEKSVQTFMIYAWSLTPARFTKPDGTVIEIDKEDPDKASVPLDMAREVIRVGRLSAHAQVCELLDEQVLNYRSLMIREEQKKKWTDQQLIFMNQLHLTTVMLLTGKLQLIEKGEGGAKDVVIEDRKPATQSCSAEQKEKVRQAVVAYVKSGPDLGVQRPIGRPPAVPGTSAGAAPAAGGATPEATGSAKAAPTSSASKK